MTASPFRRRYPQPRVRRPQPSDRITTLGARQVLVALVEDLVDYEVTGASPVGDVEARRALFPGALGGVTFVIHERFRDHLLAAYAEEISDDHVRAAGGDEVAVAEARSDRILAGLDPEDAAEVREVLEATAAPVWAHEAVLDLRAARVAARPVAPDRGLHAHVEGLLLRAAERHPWPGTPVAVPTPFTRAGQREEAELVAALADLTPEEVVTAAASVVVAALEHARKYRRREQ